MSCPTLFFFAVLDHRSSVLKLRTSVSARTWSSHFVSTRWFPLRLRILRCTSLNHRNSLAVHMSNYITSIQYLVSFMIPYVPLSLLSLFQASSSCLNVFSVHPYMYILISADMSIFHKSLVRPVHRLYEFHNLHTCLNLFHTNLNFLVNHHVEIKIVENYLRVYPRICIMFLISLVHVDDCNQLVNNTLK